MPIQRLSDEALEQILHGETVEVTQEQLIRILQYAGEGMPIQMVKKAPGLYDMFSVNRRDPEWIALHPGVLTPTVTPEWALAAAAEETERLYRDSSAPHPFAHHTQTAPFIGTDSERLLAAGEDARDVQYVREALEDEREPRERRTPKGTAE